jgi:pyroglutamyl-peptidase
MTRALITGFEPFMGFGENPAWAVARMVQDEPPQGVEVTAVELPVAYGKAARGLREAVQRTEPDLVVSLGMSDRPGISVERVAVIDDCPVADNEGRKPTDEPIVPDGPAAYFSKLPIKRCVAAVRELGLPTEVSQTAGAFVCNHVFYSLMHLIATEHPDMRGGFVHVPMTPEQAAGSQRPSMPLTATSKGVRAVLATAAAHDTDIKVAEGVTS